MAWPSGTFALGPWFGNGPSPGTRMPYRRVDTDDRWVSTHGARPSYNTYQPWVRWSSGYQERLAQMGAQYRYVVSIGYNKPVLPMSTTARPAAARGVDTRAGGGIFLHVMGRSLGGATAGCVSVTRDRMRALLRWLDPAKKPRIAMGPESVILEPAASTSSTSATRAPADGHPGRARAPSRDHHDRRVRPRRPADRRGRPMGPVTAKRRVVVIGVIHGNEHAGARVTSLMRRLGPPGGVRLWLVPTFNVDGWARNRRTNDAGVDLDRNFPKAWRLADRGGPNDSGPRAASEPETRAMTRFSRR